MPSNQRNIGAELPLAAHKGGWLCPWREIQQNAFAHQDDANKENVVAYRHSVAVLKKKSQTLGIGLPSRLNAKRNHLDFRLRLLAEQANIKLKALSRLRISLWNGPI